LKVTLIEPLARRVEFLFEVTDELKIPVEVIRGKSESIRGRYDFVTARAVAPLSRLIESTWHLVAPGGALLAMKGESAQSEIDALETGKKVHLHEIKMADIPVSRVVEVRQAG
jgi:16S rRNA (guanine527-N7)-methyltransferase